MPIKHTYTCAWCKKSFWTYQPPSSAPKNCSPECAKAQRTAHLHSIRNVVKPITNTCEVCGCKFQGRVKYKAYRACNAPECRQEIRRRAGRESAKTVLKKQREMGLMRLCLKCGHEFLSQGRFNRICGSCKANREEHTLGAEWWNGRTV